MAQVERTSEEKQTSKREKAKKARSRRVGATGDYQLDFTSWLIIAALNAALIAEQGALRVGLTRDGGTLALGVYLGEDYATEYVKPNENIAEACGEIAAVWCADKGERFYDAMAKLKEAGYEV